MRGTWWGLLLSAAALSIVIANSASTSGQTQQPWPGVLDEHPDIQYASRPTTDRVARLNRTITQNQTKRDNEINGCYNGSEL